MTFNDIKSKIYFLTSTTSSDFPIADLTSEANNALDRVVSLILQADGRFQFDDNNQTDLPIARLDLVSGQRDYSLATSHLNILDVQVADENGTLRPLTPIDQRDFEKDSLETRFATSGAPEFYDKLGTSVFLYPAPNYNETNGLRIFFQRGGSYFTTADTTKEAGFASTFHELIPLWVAYNYAIANGKQNAPLLMAEIQRKEAELVKFYGHRDKDDRPVMTMRPIFFR